MSGKDDYIFGLKNQEDKDAERNRILEMIRRAEAQAGVKKPSLADIFPPPAPEREQIRKIKKLPKVRVRRRGQTS